MSPPIAVHLAAGVVAVAIVVLGQWWGSPPAITLVIPAALGACLALPFVVHELLSVERTARSWYRLLGLAIILWSIGQAVSAIEEQRGVRSVIGAGGTVVLSSFVLAAIALTRMIRNSAFARPALRLGIDALMFGTTGCLLVWRWRYETSPESGSIALALAPPAVVGAVAVLLSVRRPARPQLDLTVGLALFALGGLFAVRSGLESPSPSVLSAVLYCLGVPVLLIGAQHNRTVGEPFADVQADGRQAAAALGGTLMGAVAFVVVQFVDRHPATTAGSILIGVATGAFLARQMLDHHQRTIVFRRLNRQLRTDPMTKMGNRLVIEQLPDSVAFDLVVVGIEGAARLSDLHGHQVGDALLTAVADALDEAVPERLAIARLDGCEFAIAVVRDVPLEGVVTLVQRAAERAVLRDQFAFGHRLTVSTGAAQPDSRDRTALDMLARAQRARHVARRQDGLVMVFDDAMWSQEQRHRLLGQRLPIALDEGRVGIHLQPIVDIAAPSGQTVVGLEALARWNDDELGQVDPNEFIPRAEANGEVVRLGLAVLRSAVRAADRLGFAETGRYVTVNVSVWQLRSIDDGGYRFSDHVGAVLDEWGQPSRVLVCEITESMLIVEGDPAVDEMQRLSDLGVRIAIDDFGSGHWALGFLRWLPADIIKIDRGLIQSIDTNERARDVVGSIVELGRRLGVALVAEGVETEAVAAAARELGVRLAQGWHFARATPIEELVAVIDRIEAGAPVPLPRNERAVSLRAVEGR